MCVKKKYENVVNANVASFLCNKKNIFTPAGFIFAKSYSPQLFWKNETIYGCRKKMIWVHAGSGSRKVCRNRLIGFGLFIGFVDYKKNTSLILYESIRVFMVYSRTRVPE